MAVEERMEDSLEDQIENDDTEHGERFCDYCGEPLEDGLCSAHCHDSEDDEGRDCECEDEQ